MTVYQSRQKLEVILIRLRYPTEMQKIMMYAGTPSRPVIRLLTHMNL